MSMSDFNNTSGYKVPREDHSYHIKHGIPIGEGKRGSHQEIDKKSWTGQIITRAKSSIDPRKYTPQVDWNKKSKERPNLAIPRVKKVTSTEQIILEKKSIPGPSQYPNTEQKHKIYGHYGKTEPKCTVTETTIFVKKGIPAPSLYESRGKSMSDIISDKISKVNQPSKSPDKRFERL